MASASHGGSPLSRVVFFALCLVVAVAIPVACWGLFRWNALYFAIQFSRDAWSVALVGVYAGLVACLAGYVAVTAIRGRNGRTGTRSPPSAGYASSRARMVAALLEVGLAAAIVTGYLAVVTVLDFKPVLDHFPVSVALGLGTGALALVFLCHAGVIFSLRFSRANPARARGKASRGANPARHVGWLALVVALAFPGYLLLGAINVVPFEFTQAHATNFGFTDDFEADTPGHPPARWITSLSGIGNSWEVGTAGEGQVLVHAGGDPGANVSENPSVSSTTTPALLHVFSKSTAFSARVQVTGPGNAGGVWLVARWNEVDAWVRAGFNFTTRAWEIQERRGVVDAPRTLARLPAAPPAASQWFVLEIVTVGRSVGLHVDGTLTLRARCSHVTYGRVGLAASGVNASFDEVSYAGEGRVNLGVVECTLRGGYGENASESIDLVALPNGTLLSSHGNRLLASTNAGLTWTDHARLPEGARTRNLLWLPNGTLLAVYARVNAQGRRRDFVVRSPDTGRTWSAPSPVQPAWDHRATMNNKIMQVSSGRIFFTSGETRAGKLNEGGLLNFYSDDGGVTWTAAETALNWTALHFNVQEGKVMECPNGTLKTLVRTDAGYLYQSLSNDGGVHWGIPFPEPQLPSTRCAFNVERDPATGYNYVFWTYEDTTKAVAPQYPRERVALAFTRDGGTWEYLMDVDDWEGAPRGYRFKNLGLKVTPEHVFLTVERREVGEAFQVRLTRVTKANVSPWAAFPGTHPLDPVTDTWQLLA